MLRLVHQFPSSHQLWFYFLVGLTLFGSTASVFRVTTAYAAGKNKDPLVTIVVDDTPASCLIVKTLRDRKTHKLHKITHSKCAAWTEISTQNVPLSQVQSHQAYIMYPSTQASQSDWMRWHTEAQQLLGAKNAPQPTTPIRSASCPGAGNKNLDLSGWQVVLNDYVSAEVTFFVSQSCSNILLDQTTLSTGYIPYDNAVWWIGFDYANTSNLCKGGFPYKLYPNSNYTFYPNYTQALGYYGRFDLDSGNLCFFGQGGVLKYLFVGPLD